MQEVREHFWIVSSILCNVYSAMMIKVQVSKVGAFPLEFRGRVSFFMKLFLDPWIWSSLFATFAAGLFWMVAMTKFRLSYAYPFTALGYASVLVLSIAFLGESFSWYRFFGVSLIAVGIFISCQHS